MCQNFLMNLKEQGSASSQTCSMILYDTGLSASMAIRVSHSYRLFRRSMVLASMTIISLGSFSSDQRADRINYLSALLDKNDDYKPYIKNHKEQWAVTGWARKKYEREHIAELGYYDMYRDELKSMIKEPDKKIMP